MKEYKHPTMGRFTRGEFDCFVQRVTIGGKKVPLMLDCAFEGSDREEAHLEACVKIAERVYDGIDQLVTRAVDLASKQCLPTVNLIRQAEGSSPLSAEQFRKRMKLMDVNLSPSGGMVTLSANSYEDEHGLVRIPFGPQGGLKKAYIE